MEAARCKCSKMSNTQACYMSFYGFLGMLSLLQALKLIEIRATEAATEAMEATWRLQCVNIRIFISKACHMSLHELLGMLS